MCPRYLLGHNMQPHKMLRSLNYSLSNTEEQKISFLCCQCNLCELFACPVGINPRSANIYIRQKLIEQNIKYTPVETEFHPRKSREFRLLPSKRLVARLGLSEYDKSAPMTEMEINIEEVHIATRQHVGAPAKAIVSVGDRVKQGQLIGEIPENSLGAAIHSSIEGTVLEINNDFIVIRRG